MTSFRRKLKKCNLMIIGASGGVANAFLHHLSDYRGLFRKIVLVDKNDRLLKDVYINHKLLDYVFIQKKIELPDKEHEYLALLKAHNIDIVLEQIKQGYHILTLLLMMIKKMWKNYI